MLTETSDVRSFCGGFREGPLDVPTVEIFDLVGRLPLDVVAELNRCDSDDARREGFLGRKFFVSRVHGILGLAGSESQETQPRASPLKKPSTRTLELTAKIVLWLFHQTPS
jgi:hypothetical protein